MLPARQLRQLWGERQPAGDPAREPFSRGGGRRRRADPRGGGGAAATAATAAAAAAHAAPAAQSDADEQPDADERLRRRRRPRPRRHQPGAAGAASERQQPERRQRRQGRVRALEPRGGPANGDPPPRRAALAGDTPVNAAPRRGGVCAARTWARARRGRRSRVRGLGTRCPPCRLGRSTLTRQCRRHMPHAGSALGRPGRRATALCGDGGATGSWCSVLDTEEGTPASRRQKMPFFLMELRWVSNPSFPTAGVARHPKHPRQKNRH